MRVLTRVTENIAQPTVKSSMEFFPLPKIREKQIKALNFFDRMAAQGTKDIIIAAPTGSGKSAVAAAVAFWAAQSALPKVPNTQQGAYVLVTQLLLQDQIENDIQRYPEHLKKAASLKSGAAYACGQFGTCGAGTKMKPPCADYRAKMCEYLTRKGTFVSADMSVTNYPYMFTERTYVGAMLPRRVVVMDECHSVPDQILNFIEMTVGPADISKYAPRAGALPPMGHISEFTKWIRSRYLTEIAKRIDAFGGEAGLDRRQAKELEELTSHHSRMKGAADEADSDNDNWVFWQEETDTDSGPELKAIAKPIESAPYFEDLVGGSGQIRVYMSAYPGAKAPFCRSLGLDPDQTAMLSLGSTFPVQNRPFHAIGVGSMSRKNIEETMPSFLRCVEGIANSHVNEKGMVHTITYAIAQKISDYFKGTPIGARLICPRNASEREEAYVKHCESKTPTIIVSPSFMEGFDFAEDKARWQIIAKVPYKSLGDAQTQAKMERDPEWYQQCAVSSIIQATGRVCRSETDQGSTYMMDADFKRFFKANDHLFPNWFKEAVNIHD